MLQYFIFAIISLTVLVQQNNAILPSQAQPQLETFKQWDLLNFNFPWDWPVNDNEFFNPAQIVATGVDFDDDRIFIALPRLFSGVPATLTSISRRNSGDSPILEAYPDWSHHDAGQKQYNCSDIGLVSVYRLKLDSCNRLWALDAGVSRSLEDFEVTCPPKILIYDLKTDQVVRRIDFPREVLRRESLFTNLIVDETTSNPANNCDDVFVYITDTVAPAIVVYDSAKDFTWRLTHPAMYPDPDFGETTIGEHKFTLMDGVVGIAFDPRIQQVYFQPLATDRLFSISTKALRGGPIDPRSELPVKLVGRKSSQGIGLAVSQSGSIFFGPFTETAIAEWNPNTNTQTVLAYDPERIQFPADIRISPHDPDYVYILSSKFHRYFLKNLNEHEINIRLLRIRIGATEVSTYSPFGVKLRGYEKFKQTSDLYNFNTKPASIAAQYISSSPAPIAQSLSSTLNPSAFVHNYIKNLRTTPYNYETVTVLNKFPSNPFPSLNTGENPLYARTYVQPQTPFQSDYNGLRFAKSISYNTSIIH